MVKDDIIIRNASIEDIDQIMNLEINSFDTGIREVKKTYADRLKIFEDGCLVIEGKNKNIIGFVTSELWDVIKENKDYYKKFDLNHDVSKVHTDEGKELYISSIAISKDYQHKGYGNLIFNKLIDKMILKYGIEAVSLIVSENWASARKLYNRNGFSEIYRIEEFFNCNDGKFNGIIMKKEL
ncbi:ribosomal-protein-alanine N-acetyltransferase [Methanococcus voltae]|uniref:Ribosomal-protein-alanine N-acetyltransferase n=2 Tax=Methanococcus voltae TaxID=2188 RepID=A0A8J7S050_METVO|nr:N-acetyltransferase [Methanococcus voltae]MBP2200975.1 ribosomal-protein-alanine N-acetyltransferase [Methanococcus voltae]MCS3921699.1 ribosomal-protein-alanine N-acetyltransferase [Methanococcus voltae PS]